MTYSAILEAEIAEGAPLDNATLTKIKDNFDYLKDSSGGGGGGSLEFSTNEVPAPLKEAIGDFNVLTFEDEVGAKTKITVLVPSSYAGGIIPKMQIGFFSPNNQADKNVKFRATTELLQPNDSFENNSGVFAKTNTITDNSVANALVSSEIDLSNAGGLINSIAIEAGDILAITLDRVEGDTVTEDVYLVPSLTNIKFTD